MKLIKTEVIGGRVVFRFQAETADDAELMKLVGTGMIHGSCGSCTHIAETPHRHEYNVTISQCKPIQGYWSGGAPCPVCGDIGNKKTEHVCKHDVGHYIKDLTVNDRPVFYCKMCNCYITK